MSDATGSSRSGAPPAAPGARPRLLDRVRQAIRMRHYSRRTEQAYVDWVRRFALFHDKRHPETTGAADIRAFLSWLATQRHVSASTQNQALSALLFLYRRVLQIEIGPWIPWRGRSGRRACRWRSPKTRPCGCWRSSTGSCGSIKWANPAGSPAIAADGGCCHDWAAAAEPRSLGGQSTNGN